MAGNAVILKPSEITPLTSLLMAEMMRECGMPDGVFQVATGLGETGAALVDEVDMIMFTGSTATGKKVMEKAAETLTPVSLELGGKDPMIVLADADLERAAKRRVLRDVQRRPDLHLRRARVRRGAGLRRVRRPRSPRRSARCARACPAGPGSVESARSPSPSSSTSSSATSRTRRQGRPRDRRRPKRHEGEGGYFYEPTVLVDVDHSMACMTEETFGPTLPIMKVADAEEAIRLANDSPYGLGASVLDKDSRAASGRAPRRAGAVCVNDAIINYAARSCRWAAGRPPGLGSATAPAASASTAAPAATTRRSRAPRRRRRPGAGRSPRRPRASSRSACG
jgi:acyl-CoA reductase-like NAD-dependent aldehyde dehydrogenase